MMLQVDIDEYVTQALTNVSDWVYNFRVLKQRR